MSASFDAFFRTATGNAPYDYQRRLAWLETLLRSADAVGSARPAHAKQP